MMIAKAYSSSDWEQSPCEDSVQPLIMRKEMFDMPLADRTRRPYCKMKFLPLQVLEFLDRKQIPGNENLWNRLSQQFPI